jgi:hypothetical protein
MGVEMTQIHLVKLLPMAATQNFCAVDDSFQHVLPLLELYEIHNSA